MARKKRFLLLSREMRLGARNILFFDKLGLGLFIATPEFGLIACQLFSAPILFRSSIFYQEFVNFVMR